MAAYSADSKAAGAYGDAPRSASRPYEIISAIDAGEMGISYADTLVVAFRWRERS